MLYKFHHINQYFFDILNNSELWFSKPDDFNDPFDMQIQLEICMSKEDKDQAINSIVEKLHTPDFRFDKKVVAEALKQRSYGINQDDNVRQLLLNEFKNLGVCCFSKDYDNILLWSHYTNGHKGICLGFDFSVPYDYLLHPLEVVYSKDLPLVKEKNEILKGLLTKSPDWQYENEFRIVVPEAGLHSFSTNHLKQVIFGAKTSSADIDRIKETANSRYTGIIFKKAKLSRTKYELEFEEI